jgi:hypothetical protein
MPLSVPWQDIVLAAGTAVGIASKAEALRSTDTVWPRRASLPNAALYVPSIAAFATLGLWLAAATATLSMLLWFGIGIWRAPADE